MDITKKDLYHNSGTRMFSEDYVDVISVPVPLANWRAFVLPKNREENIPEPTHRMVPISDARVFNKGDRILIDLLNGKSQERIVERVVGRVIFLQNPLDYLPKIGGDVLKIIGRKSTQVDSRFDLEAEEGMRKFNEHQLKLKEEYYKQYKESQKTDGQ